MARSRRFWHYFSLLMITAAAAAVMVLVSLRNSGEAVQARIHDIEPSEINAVPPAPVAVQPIRQEEIELYNTYSGMIRPMERYSLAFEIGGRVESLGTNSSGQPLDVGDAVEAGQVLATLDKDALVALQREAEARLQVAQTELRRAEDLRRRNATALSEAEYDRRVAEFEVAEAQHALAEENLRDATLRAPVAGVLSQRLLKAGESVNAQQPVFELVVVEEVLLVMGVPESDIPEIWNRQRQVEWNQTATDPEVAQRDRQFQAYVELVGRDRFGEAWPKRLGTVYRISETADDKTGLFEIEVKLENRDRMLKPGMVARGQLVTGRVTGFQVPAMSVVFQQDKAYLFTIPAGGPDSLKPGELHQAERVELVRWVEQGPQVVVPEPPGEIAAAVVRGQHRLVDGQPVRIATIETPRTPTLRPDIDIRATTAGAPAAE